MALGRNRRGSGEFPDPRRGHNVDMAHHRDLPFPVLPMLATAGEPPAGTTAAHYAYEIKWDGVRAISYVSPADGDVRVTGRRGNEVTASYPELRALGGRLGGHSAVLDGEIVAFDTDGLPSFAELQRRMHVTDPRRHGLLARVPVHYIVFDLLYLDGSPLYQVDYEHRRELLNNLDLEEDPIQAPRELRAEDGTQARDLLEATRRQGLEGLVAKRLDSRYLPGRRSEAWRKLKNIATQEVVIAGWKPGQGRRAGGIGSLLLGTYDGDELRYVGHVGTGFTDATLDDLLERLRPLRRDTSPYAEAVPRQYARDARWVEPRLVGEVEFTVWTQDGRLRAPSWRGLRPDKRPEEVRKEAG